MLALEDDIAEYDGFPSEPLASASKSQLTDDCLLIRLLPVNFLLEEGLGRAAHTRPLAEVDMVASYLCMYHDDQDRKAIIPKVSTGVPVRSLWGESASAGLQHQEA